MSNHQSLPVTGSHRTGMEDLHDRFLHTTLEDCPKPSVPFLGEREQTFGNDLRAFGSGYAIFAHLAIFSLFALVSATNISFGFCLLVDQISLAAYFCRLRWGWEEKEVKMLLCALRIMTPFPSARWELLLLLTFFLAARTSGC